MPGVRRRQAAHFGFVRQKFLIKPVKAISPFKLKRLWAFVASLPVLCVTLWQCAGAYFSDEQELILTAGPMLRGIVIATLASLFCIVLSLQLLGVSWKRFLFGNPVDVKRDVSDGLKYGVVAVFAVLGFSFLQNLVFEFFSIEISNQQVFEIFDSGEHEFGLKVLLALDGVLLAPLMEEMLFRGVLLRCWAHISKRFAIPLLVGAGYFAAMHLHWQTFAPLMLFAVGLGLVWRKRRSLVAPIVMHTLFNLINLLLYIASSEQPSVV